MAKRKVVTVQLADYLADQEPQALKGLLSAPLAYRTERLIAILKGARVLGEVRPAELIAALLHAAKPDPEDLSEKVRAYREAQVWETRRALGEVTDEEGPWRVWLPGQGERWG